MNEPREFDFAPQKRAARCDVEDKNTLTTSQSFVDSDFAGDPVSRKQYYGIGGSDG